jgi:hypothetical protein
LITAAANGIDPSLLLGNHPGVPEEVETLLDRRDGADGEEFLVHWKGFDSSYDDWLPWDALDCPAVLEAFENRGGGKGDDAGDSDYQEG